MEEWSGDKNEEVLFFGMYHKKDYKRLLNHKGFAYIFWCGSDILNLSKAPLWYRFLLKRKQTVHWCENDVEAKVLLKFFNKRINVCPSYVGDIPEVSFKPSQNPQVWLSCRPERKKEYGIGLVEEISKEVPEVTFHVYGIKNIYFYYAFHNIIYHGNVSEQQFNEEIKNYQAGLRLNEFDGFSEVLAKSILMGQYPISRIGYRFISSFVNKEELVQLLRNLKNYTEPNYAGRAYYLATLNKFPWLR